MEHKFILNQFEVNQFLAECGEWKSKISGTKHQDNVLTVYTQTALNEQELTELQSVVQNHVADFTTQFVVKTVAENKRFAENMMERLKKKNILEGLSSIDQAAWIHHRMRKMAFTLSDEETIVHIDLMNLVVSGDIETAEFVLGQMAPDDMSEPYHWMTQARIDWIRNEIRTYLGWPLI
jgi:hypothetical protein